MRTRTFASVPIIPIRYLALPLLLFISLAGCFTAPSPDLGKLKCTTDQQCPAGYSCLAPNQVGGCCKPGTPCPVIVAIDASNPDLSPADLRIASEVQPMGTGGTGGLIAPDGAAAGGAGGTAPLDASVSDSPADMPARDVAMEEATMDIPTDAAIDAPGTCGVDKDCPTQSPLCLANKCAKCTTDTDCVGRTGPACQTSSGLCVACTSSKYCTGVAATCDPATNQCTGCVTRSDCSGACLTCTSGVCTSVKNQDDPGVCAGTCDATGACKAKKGQTCQATTDCAGGLPCADGYCCDSACTGSCQACNVAASLGTCTTLAANAAPHTGHPACTGTDVCIGKCSGTSPDCTFPTASTACGTASCSSSNSYQGAGTCNAGTCSLPNAKTCPNGCVVSSGGCTDCKPTTTGCSGTGVPQLCDGTGTWQNQTACLTGFTCASGSCTCATGKTNCTTACTDLLSDPKNCGTCGHDCLGGACSSGSCQPVAVTGVLSSSPAVFAVDSQYVYYQIPSASTSTAADAYRVLKSGAGQNGSFLATSDTFHGFSDAIGSTFFETGMGGSLAFMTVGGGGGFTQAAIPNPNASSWPVLWTSVSPRYYAETTDDSSASTFTVSWFNLSNGLITSASQNKMAGVSSGGSASFYTPAYAGGDSVYWMKGLWDSANNLQQVDVFTASASQTTPIQIGTVTTDITAIIDVSAKSVLMATSSYDVYRIPLPASNSASPAQFAMSVGTYNAVEDANGMYFIDSSYFLYRCSPANCGTTKTRLATDQPTQSQGEFSVTTLFQDDTALYWGRSSSITSTGANQIMRLAK